MRNVTPTVFSNCRFEVFRFDFGQYRIVETPQSIRSKLFPSGYRSRGIPNNVIKMIDRVGRFPDNVHEVEWIVGFWHQISPDDEASEVDQGGNTFEQMVYSKEHDWVTSPEFIGPGVTYTQQESMTNAEHAPAMASPIRTDEQIVPRNRWVPIGKRKLLSE
ncbi:hypothetical protein Tco_0006733 [Tanacetum coccineum]